MPEITIGYGRQDQGIDIRNSDSGFFERGKAYPEQIWWADWNGSKVPFFFGEPVTELLTRHENGRVTINADIFAPAFYLLSGWQEYYSNSRDQFGRFPYKDSIQFKHGFVTQPVVNYYFDILASAIELATQQRPQRKLWPENNFITCLTHDIDRAESGWKIGGLAALKNGRFAQFLELLFSKAIGKDKWHNLTEIADLEERYNTCGTHFFLPESQKVNGHPNADHDVAARKYQKLMKGLTQRGHEIAVHGSFGTGSNQKKFQQEIGKLPGKVKGNRFHYLQYLPEISPDVLEESGLEWDSTLGFAEHYGFRNSYCFPFRPWNFKRRKMHGYTELPLNLMDVTLRHPNYLMLEPNQMPEAVTPMISEIEKFGGCFTLLWHNENFTGYQYPQDGQVFEEIVGLCKAKGSRFATCSHAVEAIFRGIRG